MDSEEIKLIKKISEGDVFAFEHLFRTYHASLFYYAKNLTRNEELSREIVNDVFLKFWDKRTRLTIRTSIRSYLYISVRNRYLNLLRQKNDWLEYQSEEDLKIQCAISYFSNSTIFFAALSELPGSPINSFKRL